MTIEKYIKTYCGGDYNAFDAQVREGKVKEIGEHWTTGYEFAVMYHDEERNIEIEKLVYVGE